MSISYCIPCTIITTGDIHKKNEKKFGLKITYIEHNQITINSKAVHVLVSHSTPVSVGRDKILSHEL